jgi:type II secretory pathway pseudopilin PulG
MINRAHGIALIDLLVLVALISVLATSFIPQLAVFAVRTQNAAAISDLRNTVAAEQALYVDYGGYGVSSIGAFPASGGTGAGSQLFGPLSPATTTAMGGALTMGPAVGPPSKPIVGIGIAVSSGVTLRADTIVNYSSPLLGYGASYVIVAKHWMGDTAYAAESEQKRSIYLCRSSSVMWVGTSGLGMVFIPQPSTYTDLTNYTMCGGMEIPNWTLLM